MRNIFLASKVGRSRLNKFAAGLLMFSLNFSLGGVAAFVPFNFAYANDTGYLSANATIAENSVSNEDNGWASNNAHAVFSASTDWAEYGFPDLGIPAGATINGIEITIEGNTNSASKPRHLTAALWNTSGNPDSYTASKTATLTTSDTVKLLGGPSDLWGKTWTVADFADATFKVKIGATNADNGSNAFLDAVQIKVYFTPVVVDTDHDGVPDTSDNCPTTANANQANNDGDAQGDACDNDDDNDTVLDTGDNCQFTSNLNQKDSDGDGIGNACDETPTQPENTTLTCGDGRDNDDDGATDLADTGCRGTLTVTKVVVNGQYGTKTVGDFTLKVCPTESPLVTLLGVKTAYATFVDPCITVTSGALNTLTPGWYQVSEVTDPNYSLAYTAGDCDLDGKVHIGVGDAKSCELTNTNTYTPPPTCEFGGEYPDCNPAPQSCEEQTSTMTVVSDTTNTTGVETNAVETWMHPAWTASVGDVTAKWIWNAVDVTAPRTGETVTLTKTFTVTGTPTGGSLTVAADNTYEVTLNGNPVGASADLNNFQSGTEDTYAVSPVSGSNTLVFTVHNAPYDTDDAHTNPAGLLYRLTVNKNACEPTPAPVCNPEVNLLENAGFEAPTTASWTIVPFSDVSLKWLGDWVVPHEDESPLGLEIQNNVAGSPAEGNQHAELDGYHPTAIWQNIPTNSGYDYALTFKYSPRPGTALGNNVLEVRKDGVALGAQISRGSTQGNTEWSLESRGFTASGATTKIEFADVSATDDSLGTYLDDMSLTCVGPHVPKATVVATKVVCNDESMLPNWSGYGHAITANTATDYVAEHEGCHIDPNWQFQWAPTSAGNPGDNTGAASGWNTFTSSALITLGDMTSVWVREVFQSGYVPFTGTADVNKVSAEMYCNGDALHYDNLDYANGLTDGGTVYCVAFNAPVDNDNEDEECDEGQQFIEGECVTPPPSCPQGQHESGDGCVPDEVPQTPTGGGGGSGTFDYYGCTNPQATNYNPLANKNDGSCQLPSGGEPQGSAPQGEVLGASTVAPELPLPASCSDEYLKTYMKMGRKNDVEDVKRLQTFLNEQSNANIPVTGFFGAVTKNWVKKYQKLHHDDIIKPWIDAGFSGPELSEGTGYVFKTTKRYINLVKCNALSLPMPELTPDN